MESFRVMESPPDQRQTYAVHAIKYANRPARRPEHFMGGDPHDDPMDMDYFVWLAIETEADGTDKPEGRVWVIDTGFDTLDAERRNRTIVRSVTDGLATLGVTAAEVDDVILTHLHYDHVGGFAQFPAARFHLQDREMQYASGRHMAHRVFNHAYTADHVADLVHLVHDGRVVFHDGDASLTSGLSVHLVGGHTMGLQVVRVWTRVGWVVLASDASHFYENSETGRPFPIVHDLGAMLEGYRRCRELASDPSFVIPGHDPRVFDRYRASAEGLDGIAVRVDDKPA